jgi:hypothetical protein
MCRSRGKHLLLLLTMLRIRYKRSTLWQDNFSVSTFFVEGALLLFVKALHSRVFVRLQEDGALCAVLLMVAAAAVPTLQSR